MNVTFAGLTGNYADLSQIQILSDLRVFCANFSLQSSALSGGYIYNCLKKSKVFLGMIPLQKKCAATQFKLNTSSL